MQLEDSLIEGEGEMDVSDSEDEPQRKKSMRNQSDGNEDIEKLQTLKEENDSLRCQLEAYKNEVCVNSESTMDDTHEICNLRISRLALGGSFKVGNEG